jgi:hypothetical protein
VTAHEVTCWRVLAVLVVPPATVAVVCAWWAIDQAAYAYRLWRNARRPFSLLGG